MVLAPGCPLWAAVFEYLRRINETTWTYALGTTKTDTTGRRREKPLHGDVAVALQAWLDVAKVTESPLLRRLYRGGGTGPGLSSDQVARIVQRRALLAGLAGDWAGHSGSETAADALITVLHGLDGVEHIKQVADLMAHMDDEDSSSAGLVDDVGPGVHAIEIKMPDHLLADRVRELAGTTAEMLDATIEFVDEF